MKITVYTKPPKTCQPCEATKRLLGRRGVEFEAVDVTEDAPARELLAAWGYREAPVVHVRGAEDEVRFRLGALPGVHVTPRDARWSGFRPDALAIVAPRGGARG